jgi:hypothetical protein
MNPRLKKNKHGANDNDDDDKETFGIDDSARKKRRNGPLKKDTKGMVDNQQRVPQNQESSVLITQSIGLLWRLDALRIDHPQQWLAVRQVRIPFCFARRSPVMRGGGDWSESNKNTITLSFEQETRATTTTTTITTTTTTTTTTANVRAVPADLQAGGFEVRYLDLYEVISLALSSVKRFSISPDLCTNDDEDVLAPLAEFEYAPDGGATGDPDRQSKSAMAAAAPSLCKTDASDDDADATDNARSTTTKKNRQHATAASTTATAAAAVAAAATAHGRTADDVRIAGTRTLDKQPFADSRVRVYATTFSFDGDGDAAVDVLRHTNNDKQRAFDPRVRAKFDYLHMNTIDGAPWSTRVSAGSIFKAEIDDRVPAQLRESLREPRNSTAWRDQMARYVAAAAEQSRSPLYTAALFEDLFADKRGLETFRTLLQKRHAALDAVPNYRAVAFHLLDAVDSLLVELIDAEPPCYNNDRAPSCESVPFLNRLFRGWDDSLYTNMRLLVYPYSANSNYNQYEYDCRRQDRCWGATESQERMKAYDWANDGDDQEKMQAHFAVKFRTTQMFEPHYAARRFYRHFIDSLNNGDRSMFAPLIPTPSGDDNANSSDNVDNANDDNANSSGSDDDDAAQQRMLRFNRLFAQVALKPAQRGALHLDILDRVASETALDNGFMLTFLFDPTDSIDSSMQNEFGNLYAGVRRQEKNPFQRFAEQVEHFLFGTQQDRDAARERYKPVVSYINNYILPRVENAALFRPLAQYNLPEPLLSLTQLVECRGEESLLEYDAQEAKEADIINWKAFEATLNFRLSDRAVADRCANLPLEAFQHNALDDYSKATSFVQTCIKHAAPFNRSADRKEMPFSYLYDYALYCIDRKLNRRIAKSVERWAAADLRREQAYLANRHDPNFIYYDDHPEEPYDFLAPPTTTTAASSSSTAAGAAATTATAPKRVSALARWYKKN